MRKALLLAVVAVTAGAGERCWGKLGETAEQMEARYGKPVSEGAPTSMKIRFYKLGDQEIGAGFLNGVCAGETILPKDKQRKFSDQACLDFATALTDQTNWVVESVSADGLVKEWSCDKQYYARRTRSAGEADGFSVSNRAMKEIMDAERHDEDKGLALYLSLSTPTNSASREQPGKTQKETDAKIVRMQQQWAEKGDAFGQFKMGKRYLSGDGVEKDEKKGREYLEKSAKQGYAEAKEALGKLPKARD